MVITFVLDYTSWQSYKKFSNFVTNIIVFEYNERKKGIWK